MKNHDHKCNCEECKRLTIGDIVEWSGSKSQLTSALNRRSINAVWNDSRKVTPGDVFVAIKTDKDDGHNYVNAAFKAGAVAVIVDRKAMVECSAANSKKLIAVNDPVKAVQKIAANYRKRLGILFIGVTGSNGKTTTRSFISSVLRQSYIVGETFGNWNNHIGVPLSVLKFTGEEWVGVIEMGANHVNEIHDLSTVVRPDIGIITNIGYGHVGLFGSITNTAKAKFEIADGLSRDGFLLLNGDDTRLVKGAKERGIKTEFFGYSSRCAIRPENVKIDPVKGITFSVDGYKFRISMPGRHFIYCALPAIFMGRRCGISDEAIAMALESLKPVSMRGTVEKKKDAYFIVDCYNANPSSMKSAVTYLTDVAKASKRVAIVGDMLELGKYSRRLHEELGKDLANAGVKKIIAVGEFAETVAKGAIGEGFKSRAIFTVKSAVDAVEVARKEVSAGDTVLLKGSRGIHLETIFEKF